MHATPAQPITRPVNTALSQYYKSVEATSQLTAAAERVLLLEYAATKSPKARDKIIEGALRYVISEARKHPRALHDRMVLEDLIAAGNIGLIRALGKFKPEAGTRFLTYAGWWVKHEMREEARRIGLLHIPAHAVVKGVRTPTTVEFNELTATEYGLYDTPVANTMTQSVARLLELTPLNTRESFIVKACYGIHTAAKTLKQIGKILDITGERVRQLRESALDRLRAAADTHDISL
jgi:RNA polymerase sigma factor (sigma-70 family)